MINWIKKGILASFFGDALHKIIFHQPCAYWTNLIPGTWFCSKLKFSIEILTLFRMGFLGLLTYKGVGKAPLPKICHTYPTISKLGTVITYLKIQKTYKFCHTPLVLLTTALLTENQQLLLYHEIQMQFAF